MRREQIKYRYIKLRNCFINCRQNRESYLDAVTYGSVEDFNGSVRSESSVTSAPIDL